MATAASQPPSAMGPLSQQTPSPAPPHAQANGPATTQPVPPEDQAPKLEEEPWIEEEKMFEMDARTPPGQAEEEFPMDENKEHMEESRPLTPVEEKEMLPERWG